jgi:hypothetical protein
MARTFAICKGLIYDLFSVPSRAIIRSCSTVSRPASTPPKRASATRTDSAPRFRYLNGVPLNDTHFDLEVNFLEYWEHTPNGSVQHFSWVTDLPVDDSNRMTLMRGARARWKIENETFNTLKNQGYHFEYNFGHGNQHLSTVLMHLMMLAFLIDQIQQRCCRLFQAALTAAKSKTRLWRKLRNRFDLCLIPDWGVLYRSIIDPPRRPLPHDTS